MVTNRKQGGKPYMAHARTLHITVRCHTCNRIVGFYVKEGDKPSKQPCPSCGSKVAVSPNQVEGEGDVGDDEPKRHV